MILNLDLDQIEPLHEVRQQRLFTELVESMRESGWQGRPLLVILCENGYVAWTGSHRIAAAIEVGLVSVPCYVVEDSSLEPQVVDAKYGHVHDSDRLEILRKLGDEEACQIMWMEGRD